MAILDQKCAFSKQTDTFLLNICNQPNLICIVVMQYLSDITLSTNYLQHTYRIMPTHQECCITSNTSHIISSTTTANIIGSNTLLLMHQLLYTKLRLSWRLQNSKTDQSPKLPFLLTRNQHNTVTDLPV